MTLPERLYPPVPGSHGEWGEIARVELPLSIQSWDNGWSDSRPPLELPRHCPARGHGLPYWPGQPVAPIGPGKLRSPPDTQLPEVSREDLSQTLHPESSSEHRLRVRRAGSHRYDDRQDDLLHRERFPHRRLPPWPANLDMSTNWTEHPDPNRPQHDRGWSSKALAVSRETGYQKGDLTTVGSPYYSLIRDFTR